MRTIYKYKLETTDRQTIELPEGAQVLTVQLQDGEPCLWALVDTGNQMVKRTFEIYGTGNPIDQCKVLLYIGTYQLRGGLLVFHVFEC